VVHTRCDCHRLPQGPIVSLNKVGLIFAGLYAIWFVSLNAWSYFVATKSGYWLNLLAALPGEILFAASMCLLRIPNSVIPIDSWLNSFYFLGAVSLVVSYFFGWALGVIMSYSDPSDPVGEDTPDWHKR
jgi:hypothetical protein